MTRPSPIHQTSQEKIKELKKGLKSDLTRVQELVILDTVQRAKNYKMPQDWQRELIKQLVEINKQGEGWNLKDTIKNVYQFIGYQPSDDVFKSLARMHEM